jgi:predicted RNA binding protein YcfA (HicA-like mRNA interferase family)
MRRGAQARSFPSPYDRNRLVAPALDHRARDHQRPIRDGFSLRNRSGSHQRYRHPDGRRVTVSFHRPGDIFRPKTLRSIVQTQARWTTDDLRRLKLIK